MNGPAEPERPRTPLLLRCPITHSLMQDPVSTVDGKKKIGVEEGFIPALFRCRSLARPRLLACKNKLANHPLTQPALFRHLPPSLALACRPHIRTQCD